MRTRGTWAGMWAQGRPEGWAPWPLHRHPGRPPRRRQRCLGRARHQGWVGAFRKFCAPAAAATICGAKIRQPWTSEITPHAQAASPRRRTCCRADAASWWPARCQSRLGTAWSRRAAWCWWGCPACGPRCSKGNGVAAAAHGEGAMASGSRFAHRPWAGCKRQAARGTPYALQRACMQPAAHNACCSVPRPAMRPTVQPDGTASPPAHGAQQGVDAGARSDGGEGVPHRAVRAGQVGEAAPAGGRAAPPLQIREVDGAPPRRAPQAALLAGQVCRVGGGKSRNIMVHQRLCRRHLAAHSGCSPNIALSPTCHMELTHTHSSARPAPPSHPHSLCRKSSV